MAYPSWSFRVGEQVDIAVDLGAVPPLLPEIATPRKPTASSPTAS